MRVRVKTDGGEMGWVAWPTPMLPGRYPDDFMVVVLLDGGVMATYDVDRLVWHWIEDADERIHSGLVQS